MTAIVGILSVSLLFALSAFLSHRGCGDGGSCDSCRSCGWWKEKNHVAD